VLVVGDSLGADLVIGLSRVLGDDRAFVLKADTRISTGLARPDYFNWPRQVAADVRALRPDLVVVMMGTNDGQAVVDGSRGYALGTPRWRAAYRERAARIMDLVTSGGRPLIWVGMPVMASPDLSARMRMINGIVRSEARSRPGVLFVDSWPLFAGGDGRYAAYLPTGSGGQEQVRYPDGIHLTPDGSERLARAVYRAMRSLWDPGQP
jgi:hypothetical protein